MIPTCPHCNQQADEFETQYGVKHSHCGLWSWGGKPLVSRETHAARIEAHKAFDTLWQIGGLFTRSDAYKALARELGIPGRDCHMSLFDLEMLKRVPPAVAEIRRKGANSRPSMSKEDRRQLSRSFPKCRCGNTLSRQRQQDGINICPSCEPTTERFSCDSIGPID